MSAKNPKFNSEAVIWEIDGSIVLSTRDPASTSPVGGSSMKLPPNSSSRVRVTLEPSPLAVSAVGGGRCNDEGDSVGDDGVGLVGVVAGLEGSGRVSDGWPEGGERIGGGVGGADGNDIGDEGWAEAVGEWGATGGVKGGAAGGDEAGATGGDRGGVTNGDGGAAAGGSGGGPKQAMGRKFIGLGSSFFSSSGCFISSSYRAFTFFNCS